MRVAVLGPTHPLKGGVAAHTTTMAARIAGAGHDVRLLGWARMYPRLLYPGEQAVPGAAPDVPPFEPTELRLRWDRPWTWWGAGRRAASVDLLVAVAVVPFQVPALLTAITAARRGRRRSAQGPRVVLVAHNVLPHEPHPGDRAAMRALVRAADTVVVHTAEQAALARLLGGRAVAVPLPPHLPGGNPDAATREELRRRHAARVQAPLRVLCWGIVRRYKGFDLLVEAARAVPGVEVTVAGELWGEAGEQVRRLAADPALAGRVRLRPGYVPGSELAGLLASHDVLALPYRDATASQNVTVAHAHGLPVLATRVGSFPDDVRDGVDGVLVEPDDLDALQGALAALTAPGEAARLAAGIADVDLESPWRRYVAALTGADA